MPWISAGATVLGGVLGGKGSKGQQPQMQLPSSNVSFSNLTPNAAAMPMYGWLAGLGQNMMQSPTPYFPGQTYVGPSGLTQQGVGALQGQGSLYEQMAGLSQAGLGNVLQGSNMLAQNAGGAQQAQGLYNQGLPYYQTAANLAGLGLNDYLAGQGNLQQAAGMTEQGANWLMGKAQGGYFDPYIQTAQKNYNFLSNAADVANNPYVQSMIEQNKLAAGDQLSGALNQLQGQSVGVGNLGSSRQGLAQGQAAGDVNKAMQQNIANMQLGAYQQGLGAQQNALSQTGSLFQNMMMPGQAMGAAGGMMGQSGNLFGQAGQMTGMAGNQAASQGGYYGQAGNQAMQGFGAGNQAAQNWINSGLGIGQIGAGLLGQGAQAMGNAAGSYLQGGQTVEGYQNAALQDQINRFNYMYQEPYQRMQMVQSILGNLTPLGVQQGSSGGMQTAQNPNYTSPMQGILGGASLGNSLGSALGGGKGGTQQQQMLNQQWSPWDSFASTFGF